jgi:CAP12/Pycsar effector protein, TIR domain
MDRDAALKLLDEIAAQLESGEESPLSPIVRKAARLAAMLGENEYRLLFQVHLDGLEGNDHPPRVQPISEKEQKRRLDVAFIADRTTSNGKVSAHPVPLIEDLLRTLHEEVRQNPKAATYETTTHEFDLRLVLRRIRNRVGLFLIDAESRLRSTSSSPPHLVVDRRKVFIGHGASAQWKDLRDFLHDRLGLEWTEFDRESAAGLTVKERIDQMLTEACFAFLVMTADDVHADGTKHARENVVHEIGLSQGRLGAKRAIVLLEEECEEFSSISGLVQIRFRSGHLLDKSEEIRKVLEREGIILPSSDAG